MPTRTIEYGSVRRTTSETGEGGVVDEGRTPRWATQSRWTTELGPSDASFDAVVCTQVAEYVPDVDRVLTEAFRVLKPGGRTIFVATDWDGVVWHSDDRARMAAVMTAWEAHCAHPRLPRSMASRLIRCGFHLDGASVFPILNLRYDDEGYSKGLAQGIRDFLGRPGGVSADDLREWHSEFERLTAAGQYFFSTSRYIFRASKPAGAPA